MMACVDLGFVEKSSPWLLESRFFPCKVGGKPAWLDLKNIPGEKDIQCQYCEEPCTFLCQVYAPYDCNETAFHRTVYIFICKKPDCCRLNENGNLKVFRCQLPKINQFYPSEPPILEQDWRTDISAEQWVKTCYVCGILAHNHCSKCKNIYYCCRAHQVYDWKHGHKQFCNTNNQRIERDEKFLFPENDLVIEAEEDESSDSEKEEDELAKYREMTENGEAGIFQDQHVQNELLSMANQMEDETFSKFRLIIDKNPDQVLRYHRGGKILYISSENKVQKIPKCTECNGERQFEFQIMPQMLNFLQLENALKSIDWGILAVFTCIKSCVPKNGYIAEYIWKQDIVEDNPPTVSHEDSDIQTKLI